MLDYFPDYPAGQKPEREFMFAIIGTIKPEILKTFVQKSRLMRSEATAVNDKECIEIKSSIMIEIMDVVSQKASFI